MAAIRAARSADGRFVQLTNAAGQDPRLSLEARGAIYFVLSLPPGRKFTARWLESQVPNGRESIRRALRELADYGYLRRVKAHGARGWWVWEQVLSDAPKDPPEPVENPVPAPEPSDGNPSHGLTSRNTVSSQVAPCDGKPSDGFPSHKDLKTEDQTRKHVPMRAVGHRTPVRGGAPDDASKDKTLGQFGQLARSRSDLPSQRPGAVDVRDLCPRCGKPDDSHPGGCPTLAGT